jgi:ribosomal protein S18 acetylase RimI-like enzyme
LNAVPTPPIRPGRADDVLGVLELWDRAGGARSSTESADDVGGLLLRDPEALLLAETDEGEIVGSLIAGWNGWRGSFYRMAVDPAHRRRGLATALVRAGEERLRALGARRLDAIVAADEPDAMAFWSAVGYELQLDRGRFVKNLR